MSEETKTPEQKEWQEYVESVGGLLKARELASKGEKEAKKALQNFQKELGEHILALEQHPSWQIVKEKLLLRLLRKSKKAFFETNLMEDNAIKQTIMHKYTVFGIETLLGTIEFYKDMMTEISTGSKRKRKKSGSEAEE